MLRESIRKATFLSLVNLPLVAVNAAAESMLLEEVVVTAQKREQNLQDVGVSVTAFSGDTIRDLGYTNSADIAQMTPGLTISEPGSVPLQLAVNIRGVSQNDFGDHNEAPNAVYIDDAYVSWLGALGFSTFDLERVEVLRGPQGTLFGRNATGGLLHYISKKPGTELEGYAQLDISDNDTIGFEGAIGGELSESVRGRASLAYQDRGDFVTNHAGPDLGDLERLAVRTQLAVDLSESVELWLKAEYSEDDGDGAAWDHRASIADTPLGTGRFLASEENAWGTCAGCDVLGFRGTDDSDPWDVDNNDPSFIDRDTLNLAAHLTWDFEALTFTSITDYRDVERLYNDDADGGIFTLTSFAQNMKGDQFSQEFRVNGKGDRSRWVAGLYYLSIDGDYHTDLKIDPTLLGLPPGPILFGLVNDYTLNANSWAVFGQAEFDFSDNWTLTGGLRWTEDDKDYQYVNTGILGGGLITDTDRAEEDYTFKLALDWRPNDDMLFYGSATRGYKAGGFSAPLDGFLTPAQAEYEDEILYSYEFGLKITIFDGTARLNGSVFYYDYQDYQAFIFTGLTQQVINLDATVQGAEFELITSPADGLDILFGLSILDTEAKNVPMPIGGGVLADRNLPQAPEISANLMVRKNWDFSRGSITLQADVNYQDDYNLNIVNHETTAVDSNSVTNVRLSYSSPEDNWGVALYVDNVFDEDYVTSAFDQSSPLLGALTIRAYNRPRWVGLSVYYEL